jgi:APA family basic amino acid/polyamine antiporter
VTARRLGLERHLGSPHLAALAYGGAGAAPFLAAGALAAGAGGAAPWVVLAVGLVMVIVALSYGEGVALAAEPGGSSAFVRRAFGDAAGFAAGWLVLLDQLLLLGLAATVLAPYMWAVAGADPPGHGARAAVAAGAILAVGAVRLVRRARLYRVAVALAALAVAVHLAVAAIGLVLVARGDLDVAGPGWGWGDVAFALPMAVLAFVGLETVASLSGEARAPGAGLTRALLAGLAAVLAVQVALVALAAQAGAPRAEPGVDGWVAAPLAALADAFEGPLPGAAVDLLRAAVGASAVAVLLALMAMVFSSAGRLALALGRREGLPHAFARLHPRTLIAPAAVGATAALGCAAALAALAAELPARALGELYGFGVLAAGTLAQVAVIRLRRREPEAERPVRVPWSIPWRGTAVPLPTLVGAMLMLALWALLVATHDGARILGPAWLVAGAGVFLGVRRAGRETLLGTVEEARPALVGEPERAFRRILVPMKGGDLGEECLATAIRVAAREGAKVEVITVVALPMERRLDAPCPDEDVAAASVLARARELAAEQDVTIAARVIRARSIGDAIVAEARARDVDLIVIGSSSRWRRMARFFSPTVDHVLRRAACEVMVVAYPEGALEESAAGGS